MIDLQNHTVSSDGELTGKELVDLAISKNLSAIAITDHDSVGSLKSAADYAKGKGIEVIPGIEISCDDPLFDFEKIDVLGLFIDYKNKEIAGIIKTVNDSREKDKKAIIEKLKGMGYDIDYKSVKKTVGGTFGRPHIAKYLIGGYPEKFSSVREVFDKLIGKGKPAFVKTKSGVTIEKAIKSIKSAGGLSILAHPGIYPREKSLSLIDFFAKKGGSGIETYYPYHVICPELKINEKENLKIIEFYKSIAKSKNVLESGGNDHHDMYRPTIGTVKIPESVLENLKNALKELK